MSADLRRWSTLLVLVLVAVAGCGGTGASTRRVGSGARQLPGPGLPAALRQVAFDVAPWRTDFARHSVPLTSILPGGPPPDGIPPIDRDRRADGRTLTFGTTGNLRNSDLVMWDRETQSWWQQFSGQAIVGSLTGTRLTEHDSQTLSFADFRTRYPQGDVLSRNTGFQRPYGQNPYAGYDTPESARPFDYGGRLDPRLPPVERVESITSRGDTVVVPFGSLRDHPVVAVSVGGVPAVVLYDPRVLSPLDEPRIANSREVGSAAAFDRRLAGRTLDFRPARAGVMTDTQTGTRWDITGRAIAGPLRGAELRRLTDLNAFWFAVAAFLPRARLVTSAG